MNESKVMFYFKTSSNVSYTVQSSLNSYSDGRWYKVHVVRGLKNASLTVRPVGPSDTGAVDYNMITTSTHGYLPVGHAIFFGGKDPNRFAMSLLEIHGVIGYQCYAQRATCVSLVLCLT